LITVLAGEERCAARHAHVGWLFVHNQRAATERYAPTCSPIRFIRS